jgi:predicted Ser/Thr protein kinase
VNFETIAPLVRKDGPLSGWVELVRWEGSVYVRKGYDGGAPFSRWMLSHEHSVLRRLQGIRGIPRLIRYEPGCWILMQYVRGDYLNRCRDGQLSPALYAKLLGIVRRIHQRGVYHLDLRHGRNYLITSEGEPYLIDFETGVIVPENPIFQPVREVLAWVDHAGLLRMKNRYFRPLISEPDRRAIRRFFALRPLWIFRPFKRRAKDLW